MQKDIIVKIETDFERSEKAMGIISKIKRDDNEPISDRIYRSIIFLAQGDIDKLNHFIDLYYEDYRDLIWQAEYEDPEVQKYDFNKSFKKLGLL